MLLLNIYQPQAPAQRPRQSVWVWASFCGFALLTVLNLTPPAHAKRLDTTTRFDAQNLAAAAPAAAQAVTARATTATPAPVKRQVKPRAVEAPNPTLLPPLAAPTVTYVADEYVPVEPIAQDLDIPQLADLE